MVRDLSTRASNICTQDFLQSNYSHTEFMKAEDKLRPPLRTL